MKPFFCKTAIALSLTLPAAANAAEYVCNVEGITVYASYQINDACRIVETNNVTENSVVAIPGDTPVLKTVQTTEFKASAADYVHTSQVTPAVQTPVVVTRNEYGVPAPISIPMAQTRQAVPANKTIADSVIVPNNTPTLEAPPTIKAEDYVADTTVRNTTPVVQTQSSATQTENSIIPVMLAAQAQPTASTEKTVSDGLAIINETPVAQPVVPAIQIPQEIIQNSAAQPQTSTTQNNQAVTAQDEALDKTPAKVETKRKGKTYAKTSSRRKAKVSRAKTAVVRASEEQAAKPIATASAEPSTPATATPVEHGKTTVPTPFPQAYKPAADILLDKGNNDSDIKILPNVPITSVTNTAEAANPRLNITLRNRQNKSRSSSYSKYKAPVIRTAPVVTPAPKPSPKETRKQILQTEVRNEQAAITRLQTQLNAAKQKGDQIKIQQLTRTINARKANIRAIQGEMSR
ncbi:hypothetical protein J4530_10555 [Neisseria subflava]|uniref:hypothetical protein n=1 Tax=Neisseria subflava TaxID=28449 RepID=UPI002029B513|nr:hypothetical protein [Neisseria subflava]MCL9788560.1 hypothetical protein [Neisseria subflava]